MKLVLIFAGLVGLFLISQKGGKNNPKIMAPNPAIVYFEQSPFNLCREFENSETSIVLTCKQNSKTDQKKNTELSINTISSFNKSISRKFKDLTSGKNIPGTLYSFNSDQSVLQVFIL